MIEKCNPYVDIVVRYKIFCKRCEIKRCFIELPKNIEIDRCPVCGADTTEIDIEKIRVIWHIPKGEEKCK